MSSQRLQGKVCIVTGSSSGIGRAIALAYAKHGARLVCADIQPKARAEIPGETATNTLDLLENDGCEAIYIQTDVTNSESVEHMVAETVATFGRIDVLVNNAGTSVESKRELQKLHDTSEDDFHQSMNINVLSVFLCCKFVLRQMLLQELNDLGDRGWIINMSSIYGLVGGNWNTCYAASKGAVTNMTKTIALDYAKSGIHCNAICPGFVGTAIFKDTIANMGGEEIINSLHPLKGVGKPQDIAGAAVFLASDDARWITGINLSVDGGFVAQ